MKICKKTLVLLGVLTLTTALAACSDNQTDSGETSGTVSNTVTETVSNNGSEDTSSVSDGTSGSSGALIDIGEDYDWKAGVEQQDYNGYDFTILNGCTADWYAYTIICPEETTGEPVNDAFIERNNRTSEFLNINIIENNNADFVNVIQNSVKAASNDFDYALCTLMNAYAIAMNNMIYDLNTIEGNVDLGNVWWDQNSVEGLSINGKLYFATSDADTTRFDSIRSLYFNKELIEQFQLENPYDLVDENKWTVDKFIAMCSAVAMDKDGDGQMTDMDLYGWVGYNEIMSDLLMCGMGAKYITKDSETGRLVNGTTGEDFIDRYNKVISLVSPQSDVVFDVRASKHSSHLRGLGDRIQEAIFTENDALFYSECMAWTRVLRDMEADFGVLPPPKYDEDQERYYSIILNSFMQMIPITSSDPVRTLHIMDVLAAASHDTVVEAYVNVTLTGKVARDADTVRMLHLVFDDLYYNIYFSNVSIRTTVNAGFSSGSDSIASKLKSNEKAFNKQLDKTNEFFFEEE